MQHFEGCGDVKRSDDMLFWLVLLGLLQKSTNLLVLLRYTSFLRPSTASFHWLPSVIPFWASNLFPGQAFGLLVLVSGVVDVWEKYTLLHGEFFEFSALFRILLINPSTVLPVGGFMLASFSIIGVVGALRENLCALRSVCFLSCLVYVFFAWELRLWNSKQMFALAKKNFHFLFLWIRTRNVRACSNNWAKGWMGKKAFSWNHYREETLKCLEIPIQ